MNTLSTLTLASLSMLLMSGAAFAGTPVTHVPEPMSLSLLAGGVLAIAAVKRLRHK